ncbi:hypothetical protein CSV79_11575 [Sporosarcina sp. P13]|nr:hypothetical protein CSV79_11575 [Sporosarcina sp. P13]
MLFTAGLVIGLVFFGLAEPIYHYVNPPFGEGNTVESAKTAMKYSFLHWSLHPFTWQLNPGTISKSRILLMFYTFTL